MLEWKKSLDSLDLEVSEMISDYIDGRIKPYSLSDTGKSKIENLLKKFEVSDLLNGVNIRLEKYIRYDSNGEILQEGIEKFMDKLGGIIALQNMHPIKQKLAYIKGIGRNRFGYWDNKKGSIILSKYVEALENHVWSNEQILEIEVIKITKML